MVQKLGDRLNIRALHSQPTRRRVPQVLETEVNDSDPSKESAKIHTNLILDDTRKHLVGRFPLVLTGNDCKTDWED
jgi:hypothetical protein